MNLRLYDTARREKRDFVPADPDRVTMYVCGPTVYGYAHIGNFRPVVAFDVLFRVLRHIYGEGHVLYARNVTDVDDKINAKAADEGVDISVITARYLAAYLEDADALGALRPTYAPEATAYIQQMVDMIADLIKRKGAYEAEGHVLFDTQAAVDYGALSGRTMDDMIAGARVEVAPYKRHPADFVLWKPSKAHEPSWPSPWGAGRPGWHSECSTMIDAVLGSPIDIHGGGIDLVFPHHENELAQAKCAHGGAPLANYWLHNGFLDMGGEKMSKSLGNVIVPHDLLKSVPGEVLRWALLSAHYRQPLDWSDEVIQSAWSALDKLYGALRRMRPTGLEGRIDAQVLEALLEDLNTPKAMSALFSLARQVETGPRELRAQFAADLKASANLFGFLSADPEKWFQDTPANMSKLQIWDLLRRRDVSRKQKDWVESDFDKNYLLKNWIKVEDGPSGSTWSVFRDPEFFEGLVERWVSEQYPNEWRREIDGVSDFCVKRNDGIQYVEAKLSIRQFKNSSAKVVNKIKERHHSDGCEIYYTLVVSSYDYRKKDAKEIMHFFSKSGVSGRVLAMDGTGGIVDYQVASADESLSRTYYV